MYAHNTFAPLRRGVGVDGGRRVLRGSVPACGWAQARISSVLDVRLVPAWLRSFPLDTCAACCTVGGMESNRENRRQEMGAEGTIRDQARRAVEVVRVGQGCYAIYRNGVEYSRYGFLADAERDARELRVVEERRLGRAS